MYVYKKTIFDLNTEIKKNNEEITDYTRFKLDIINIFIDLYKTILLKLNHHDLIKIEKIYIVQNIYKKLNSLTNKSNIKLLNDVIENLFYKIEDVDYFLDVCLFLSKKIIKNNYVIEICNNKFFNEDFESKINEPVDKFNIWFTS
jgi:hypothetical protein